MSDGVLEISTNSKTTYYAIRGAGGDVIVTSWGDAVNAGFTWKQGYGNAVKFSNKKDAEKWMKTKAFPEGTNGVVKSWITKQHPLIRLTCFSIMVTVIFIIGFKMAIKFEDYLGCRENIQLRGTSMCQALNKVTMALTDQFGKLIDIVFYEIIGAVMVFSSWSVGLI